MNAFRLLEDAAFEVPVRITSSPHLYAMIGLNGS